MSLSSPVWVGLLQISPLGSRPGPGSPQQGHSTHLLGLSTLLSQWYNNYYILLYIIIIIYKCMYIDVTKYRCFFPYCFGFGCMHIMHVCSWFYVHVFVRENLILFHHTYNYYQRVYIHIHIYPAILVSLHC